MTAPIRLGAAALLLASVSTFALLAQAETADAQTPPRLAQARPDGPPRGKKDEPEPAAKEDSAPSGNQQQESGEEKDRKGKRERSKSNGDAKGGGPEPGPKGERNGRERDRGRREGGPPEGPPREKGRGQEPPVLKKEQAPDTQPKTPPPPPEPKAKEAPKTFEQPRKERDQPPTGPRDERPERPGTPSPGGAAEPPPPAEPPKFVPLKELRPKQPPRPAESETQRVERHRKSFETLKQQRRELKEEGGKRTVIEEPDKRRIIREDGRTTIRHDETERFKRLYRDTREERGSGDSNITIAIGPGGIRIMTEVDRDGRTLRRWRRGSDGRDIVLFDNRDYYRRFGPRRPSFLDAIVNLAPPVIRIPRERYIVDYDRASDDDIYEALTAGPVDDFDGHYSLEEIRQSPYLRDRMRRLDLDTITFDFGSWEVDPRDYGRLERVARIMNRILSRNPDEMFLIEGHTDAVGSDEDNLTLSDRRAETVALILSEEFGVPPENLVTQGYGEHYLKVPTDGPERLNRRTSVRRITPLLAR